MSALLLVVWMRWLHNSSTALPRQGILALIVHVAGCAGFDYIIDWNGNGNAFSALFDSLPSASYMEQMIGLRFAAEYIFGYA